MSEDDVTLYTNPRSRGQIARWMVAEAGAPCREVILDFGKGEHKAPGFLAINPMGKVPAIVHRGTVVTETAAILTYLADAFPAAGLAPAPGDPARGSYYRWLFFGAGCFEPAFADRMFQRPEVPNRGALGWGSYTEILAVLKQALAPGPYLLGDRFSAADVHIGSLLGFAMQFGSEEVKAEPVFVDYVGRLTARDAWRRVQPAA
ncbi:MAG: glutathione S-transferase family protein [Sneathiellaceae bacterium]